MNSEHKIEEPRLHTRNWDEDISTKLLVTLPKILKVYSKTVIMKKLSLYNHINYDGLNTPVVVLLKFIISDSAKNFKSLFKDGNYEKIVFV